MDLFDLSGRVALLTGAAGGLGTAMAEAFAAKGATLMLSDRDGAACAALAARLRAHGWLAHAAAADLADASAVDALVDSALARCGRIDVLVCNAGVQGPAGPLAACTDADWEQVMGINLRSAMRL